MDQKELATTVEKAIHDLRERDAAADVERQKYGTALAETKEHLEKLQTAFSASLDAQNQLYPRVDALETWKNRPGLPGLDKSQDASPNAKAYNLYLHKGYEALSPEEWKLISVGSDPQGGVLMLPVRRQDIIERLHQASPIRGLATVDTISGSTVFEQPSEGPLNFTSGWVGETQARPETQTGNFGLERIPLHEMYSSPKVTQLMLGIAFDIEGYIDRKVVEEQAVLEGQAFISGDGVSKPSGILSDTRVATVNSGDAAALTADGIIRLIYTLPEPYARNGSFIMRRLTLMSIALMKDDMGNWLWSPGLAGVQPPTIRGYPYAEMPDMPADTAGLFPIVFGDIRRAYRIVDNSDMTVLRDPYTAKPFVLFYTTRMVGGQVVLPEAMLKMKVSV